MARVELPDELARGPFTVARALELGVRHCDLRSLGLHRPTHSVRCGEVPSGTAERAQAFARALPEDSAFSHVTAASLLGLPLPEAHETDPVLDVMRPSRRMPTRRKGCRGHRGLESREVVDVDGLRVVAVADTWCDLAELRHPALGLDDLVVAGDVAVNRLGGPEPAGVLASALGSRVSPRGGRLLGRALPLLRAGVRSPMESRARLMFVRAGFPEPEVNAPVRDAAGGWLLEGDLVWRERRVVGEYQGEVHADRQRRSADAHRAGIARDADWTVLDLWAEDLNSAPRRATTLRRFAVALGLDPSRLDIA